MNFILIIGCVLLMIPVTLVGRRLLDLKPMRVAWITAVVQTFRLVLFGTAITSAIKTSDAWMGLVIPVPPAVGLAVLIITGMVLAFTMLNLAVRGLGAPALISSVRLATDWLYSKMRNPMVLAMFLWLIAWGIYLQSTMFVAWVLFLVIPVEILFEKRYEEKELELRFGEAYLRYKEITPFMFPRFAWPRLQVKTMAAAVRHLVLMALVAVSIAVVPLVASATDWREIPFSFGGAFINADVKENQNIMVFWFLSRRIEKPSEYQAKLTDKKDSWTYKGKSFAVCLRKIEVNFGKTPREVRSAFAIYFDADGNHIGKKEVTQSDWVPESGPRLWADLLRTFFSKEGKDKDIEAIPTLAIK